MIDWVKIVELVPQAAALTTLVGIAKLPLSLAQWRQEVLRFAIHPLHP